MPRILKVCHDRILPQDMFRHQAVTRPRRGGVSRAVLEFRKMWVNGSTLRVRFMEGTAAQKEQVRREALIWTEFANLKFAFNDALDAEIRITFDPGDGAWSTVGTDARRVPQSEATMNLGFLDGGTAMHEFGHAIGLGHEHQNPAGGIQWNEAVVLKELSGPPNFWTPAQIRHNVLEKYSVDQIRGTQFDPDSIMLYFFPARWTLNGVSTKANSKLSATDKAFIASAEAYPRTESEAQPLKIDDSSPFRGSIGLPGEEDLYTFKVTAGGSYRIETRGTTDVVMKLFGPDSQTNLIAEDDDSGVGRNSRITASLIPGQYFVQIRHFDQSGGTGKYTIRVMKR